MRGHMQGSEALPGMEEDHLALFSPADPPASSSHMKVPKKTSRGTAQPPHETLINNKLLLFKPVGSGIIYYTAVLGK